MYRTISLGLLLTLLLGCAGNIDPSRQVADAALATAVRDALQGDAALRPYTIHVDVRAGLVTLTGSVRTVDLRERATSVVRSVPDVIGVENLLTVE